MKELKDTLWKAADKLRGSLSASQYKDVILGLVFLKYVSDAYDERREAIRADLLAEGYDEEQIADLIDDPEEYQGYGVFVVPPEAQWAYLSENAKGKPAVGDEPAKTIGALIDAAMDAVMKANPTLRRHAAAHLQPRQHRPAPPRRARRPVQQRALQPPGRAPRPRPHGRGLRVLPRRVRSRRGQARRRVLHAAVRW